MECQCRLEQVPLSHSLPIAYVMQTILAAKHETGMVHAHSSKQVRSKQPPNAMQGFGTPPEATAGMYTVWHRGMLSSLHTYA